MMVMNVRELIFFFSSEDVLHEFEISVDHRIIEVVWLTNTFHSEGILISHTVLDYAEVGFDEQQLVTWFISQQLLFVIWTYLVNQNFDVRFKDLMKVLTSIHHLPKDVVVSIVLIFLFNTFIPEVVFVLFHELQFLIGSVMELFQGVKLQILQKVLTVWVNLPIFIFLHFFFLYLLLI